MRVRVAHSFVRRCFAVSPVPHRGDLSSAAARAEYLAAAAPAAVPDVCLASLRAAHISSTHHDLARIRAARSMRVVFVPRASRRVEENKKRRGNCAEFRWLGARAA